MRWKNCILLVVWALLCSASYAEHSPLLPRPQQVHYGSGEISLRGMAIEFASPPDAADRFAARELQKWMRERTGLDASLDSYGNPPNHAGVPVVLDREHVKDEPLALPGEKPGPDSREAYDLTVTTQGVKIHARSSAGIFYGAQTLRQLVEGEGAQAALPVVEIHDWPSLAYRGTMVDISHGPLPTEQEFERQLDFLARWKENQYYLYTEDSIELTGYPLLNPDARLSQDEVRRIVAYARDRHIDVIPNFDLYGHQHDVFRIEQYAGMSDEPHGTEFDPRNPKVLQVLKNWANQFADLFPSAFVNIGFDETFQAQAAMSESEAQALFMKQLAAVSGFFQAREKRVMAWDDIIVKYPNAIPQLPNGLIAVAWHYTSEDPAYKRWLGPLIAHHIPYFVQPGIKSYDQIAPDFNTSFENIDTFLAAGRRSGALGLIDSVWSDDAQLLLRMSWPGMAYGAAAPWQSAAMDRPHFFSEYAQLMYPAAVAPNIASALSNLAAAETDIQKAIGTQSMFALWEDPFFPAYYIKLATHQQDLQEARLHAEQALEALFQAKSLGAKPASVDNLVIGSELLDYAGQKFQAPLDMTAIWNKFGGIRPDEERWWNEWGSQVTHYDHSYITDLMDRITDLKPQYRAEWLSEYTPYRLGSALGRWDGEYQYWRRVHEKLRHFNDSTRQGGHLPPLDEVIESPRPAWASTP